jgi:hypothetical protein
MTDRSEYVYTNSAYSTFILTFSCSSGSPFWKAGPAPLTQGVDGRKVVGASYSHADNLKFDSLYGALES